MPDSLVLTHGAGSNRDAPLLVAIDEALSAAGVKVTRINLPFRESRSSGSPRPGDAERDRKGLADAVQRAATESGGRVFLAGHSYGGRQSSMLVAEQPDLVSGLMLCSYPLHPPGKPDQLRTAHLPNLKVPTLFVHGTRDPFGSIDELRAAIALIPGRTELLQIDRSGHELAAKRATALADVSGRIAAKFLEFFK